MFTGHVGCDIKKNGEHGAACVAGYANSVGGTCIVILSQGEVASTGDWSASLLLHEIVHIFNAPDDDKNYFDPDGEDYDVDKIYRMDCVVGFSRYDPSNEKNLPICEHCKGIAKMYKYSFYNH